MSKLKWVKNALLEEELKAFETTRFIMDKINIRGNVHFYNGGTWTDNPDKPDLDLFHRVLAQYPAEQFLRLYNINDLSTFMFIKKPFDLSNILINFRESDFSLHFNHCKAILPLDHFINHERLDPMDPIMILFCKKLREEKDLREKELNSINNIYDKLTDEQKLIAEVID